MLPLAQPVVWRAWVVQPAQVQQRKSGVPRGAMQGLQPLEQRRALWLPVLQGASVRRPVPLEASPRALAGSQ